MAGDPNDPRRGHVPGEDDPDAETDAWIDALEDAMQERGRPAADLSGLSPRQAARLVHRPLDADDVAVFADAVPTPDDVPIAWATLQLLDAAAQAPLRLTRNGYLPAPLARTVGTTFQHRFGATHYDPAPRTVRGEADLHALHLARVMAERAGLLRRVDGELRLTRAGRAARVRVGPSSLLPRLLRAFYAHADEGYEVNRAEGPWVREGTGLTLYLLTRFGDRYRPARFYAERFLRAHPEAEQWDEVFTRIGTARRARMLHHAAETLVFRFAWTFGLVEADPASDRRATLLRPSEARVRATPLLAATLAFPVGAGGDDAPRASA